MTPSCSSSQNALSEGKSASVAELYNYSHNIMEVSVIPENTELIITLSLPQILVKCIDFLEKNGFSNI